MTPAQLGARAGHAVAGVGVAYAVVLAAGMAQSGFAEPIGDPLLAIMEVLTILSAVPLLALFAAVQATVPPDRRLWATLALFFAAMFCCATTGVHIVELTAGRAMARPGLVWPSLPYAVELFAWDFLLGLALLLAAQALQDTSREHRLRERRLRSWLRATGALCLFGLLGPLTGYMRIQLIGVIGYAVLLPVVAWMLTGWFRRSASGGAPLHCDVEAQRLREAV